MRLNRKKSAGIPEFRKDIVSGDWVLIAAGRGKRPMLKIKKSARLNASKKDCPFENLFFKESQPTLWLPAADKNLSARGENSLDNWWVASMLNKYPALAVHESKICPKPKRIGPYFEMDGRGFHELVVSRAHNRRIPEMADGEIAAIFNLYQARYRQLAAEPCVEYILIFHNQGLAAGASIFHPHSQIMAMPIVPPDVSKSIEGARLYYRENGMCAHCAVIEREKYEKIRLVYENRHFIVMEPFAPRAAYETRVFPKIHSARFEEINKDERTDLAKAMKAALLKIKRALKDPDYNFFIHTAPAKSSNLNYYHWHIEILPRAAIWAGLELGAGIEIISVSPEDAAEHLRRF